MLVVALGVSAAAAWACGSDFGLTARYSGMGGAGLALANDAGAVDLNPAGLGMQSLPYGAYYDTGWGLRTAPLLGSGVGSYGQIAVTDRLSRGTADEGFNYAGFNSTRWGWGLSYGYRGSEDVHSNDLTLGGAYNFSRDLSLGLSWTNAYDTDTTGSDNKNVLNAGVLWQCPCSLHPSLALTVDGMGNNSKTLTNVGVAIPYNRYGGLAIDWDDCFCECNGHLNIGTEYWLGGPRPAWALRLGVENVDADHGDSRWTFGTGYRTRAWQFDFSLMQSRSEDHHSTGGTGGTGGELVGSDLTTSGHSHDDTIKATMSFGF
jgi:hypothetical protein